MDVFICHDMIIITNSNCMFKMVSNIFQEKNTRCDSPLFFDSMSNRFELHALLNHPFLNSSIC